jgi:amino acid adenylation domain-containing protein
VNRIEDLSKNQLLRLIAKQQEKLSSLQVMGDDADIAIIGFDCRFPGQSNDPESFWRLLADGVDAVADDTSRRWKPDTFLGSADEAGKSYSMSAGLVDGVDQFDPLFFNVSPREAETMDPQQRLTLETSWRALEHAGISTSSLSGSKTGVFFGVGDNEYMQHCYASTADENIGHVASSNALNVIAGRVAYTLGLQGPCMVVDTACSSSLVAVHLACQSLRNGESRLALAGGVNVLVSGDTFVSLSKANMLSPTGRCQTFSENADGYVRAEGCGLVVLKRLSDAQRDGDRVFAVIKGSAVNQDGRSSSLTAPNGPAQISVIRDALAAARVEPSAVQLVETHGTGTGLGDPIEVQSLDAVYGVHHSAENPLYLGALKSNIGHAESAAGIAALIKVVLCLQHKKIPGNLHCKKINPKINADFSRLKLPTTLQDWPKVEREIAAVSAFGFSGTNVHLIVAAADENEQVETEEHSWPLVISARSKTALKQLLQSYYQILASRELPVAALARTLAQGRTHYDYRISFPVSSSAELRRQIGEQLQNDLAAAVQVSANKSTANEVAFLFTGQGSQYAQMGEDLYRHNARFKYHLDRCNEALAPHLDKPLLSLLWGKDTADLNNTRYTQPALFALEYSLASLWIDLGVVPDYVMGHSVGEYAAACVAGVFKLADASKLICARASLMADLKTPGSMLAVLAPLAQVEPFIANFKDVSVGAINGPASVVLSGAAESINAIEQQLTKAQIGSQFLNVSHAFHSPLMAPMLDAFRAVAQSLEYSPPTFALVSNLTGKIELERIQTAEYWVDHVLAPVNFNGGMQTLGAASISVFLEVGPTATLLGMGRRCIASDKSFWLPSLRQGQCWEPLSQALGQLYLKGFALNWASLFDKTLSILTLPGHPMDKQSYWLAAGQQAEVARVVVSKTIGHSLLGAPLALPQQGDHLYLANWNIHSPAYFDHHRLYNQVVVPAASHVAMLLLAAADTLGDKTVELRDLVFPEALTLADDAEAIIQLYLQRGQDGDHAVQLKRVDHTTGQHRLHVEGRLQAVAGVLVNEQASVQEWLAYQQDYERYFSGKAFYSEFWDLGYTLGSAFCWIKEGWQRGETVVAKMAVPELPDGADDYGLYPGLIDSCFQLIACCANGESTRLNSGKIYIPFTIESVKFRAQGSNTQELWCVASLREKPTEQSNRVIGDIRLFTPDGRLVAWIEGFQARVTDDRGLFQILGRQAAVAEPFYSIEWEEVKPDATDKVVANSAQPWLLFGSPSLKEISAKSRLNSIYLDPHCLPFKGTCLEDNLGLWYQYLPEAGSRVAGLIYELSECPQDAKSLAQEILRLSSLVKAIDKLKITLELGFIYLARDASFNSQHQQPAIAAIDAIFKVFINEGIDLGFRQVSLAANGDWLPLLNQALACDGEQIWNRGQQFLTPRLRANPRNQKAVSTGLTPGWYAITGGASGIGLEIAKYLAKTYAKGVFLLGRSEPSAEVLAFIEQAATAGVKVQAIRCDITREADVNAWVQTLDRAGIPLTGLIHAAGVVRDQPLEELDIASLEAVLAPKVDGTVNLLKALSKHPLKHLIGFSSMSSLLGTQGQAAYAVANAYLNAELANYRSEHETGTSLLWGPWAQVGMASRLDESVQRYYRERGIQAFTVEQGVAAFATAAASTSANLAVIDIDWGTYVAGSAVGSLLEKVASSSATATGVKIASSSALDLSLLAPGERAGAVRSALVSLMTNALGASEQVFANEQGELTSLGVDSLIAVDLRNKLQKQFGANIAIADMMGGMTFGGLLAAVQAGLGEIDSQEEEVALTLNPAERYLPFPITDMQQAYWIGRTGVFDLGGMSLHGYKEIESDQLDLERFQDAWRKLVARHDMLRAYILPSGEQLIAETVEPYRIAIADLRGLAADKVQAALLQTREEMSHQVLPLDTWPAFDVRASLLDGGRIRLHLSVDGTFLDFRSFLVLFRELILLYKSPDQPLPALELNFRDYVLTQRAQESSPAYQRSLAYWSERIESIAPAPELPLVKKASQVKNHRSKRWESSLSVNDWSSFKETMQQHGLTQAATLLAVYGEVLATWSSNPRFCINVPVFNRQGWHKDVNHVLGNFSSFTLVEFDYNQPFSFVERVRDVQRQLMEGLQYHHISGVQILRMINQARGKIAAGAYPCVYTSLPSGVDEWDSSLKSMITGELGEIKYTISQTPQVWIDVHVWYESGGLEFNWDAVDELFPAGMVDSMFGAYCTMIETLATQPALWQQTQIDLLPAPQQQLLADVNATAKPIGEELLQTLFYRAADEFPQELALISSHTSITYAQLREQANRLAHRLRAEGVVRNQLVAVAMPKSVEQIVAVMGILIAGGAYLPVDLNQPQPRIDYLLANGQVQIVLVANDEDLARQWPETVQAYRLADASADAATDLAPIQQQTDLAYVLYTSGSTGKPKGVMISHRNVVNMVEHTNSHFAVKAGDRAFNITALNHDLSVYDIFGCLAAGAGLVIPDEDKRREPKHWFELMQAHRVTLWNSVPALMDMLLESSDEQAKLADLRVVILGGDWVSPSLPERIHQLAPAANLLSIGGPTETTVWNIWYFMNEVKTDWSSIPYGKPISNSKYFILNTSGKPCPVWVPGELCAAGECVAQGYLNDPENTQRSFVNHPFTGEAIYKTGDIGRYLPDGTIEFLGRKDFQLKIRGQRIEAGEIEHALLGFEGVDNAVIVDAGEGLQKHLVAHIEMEGAQQNFAQANKTADFLSDDEQQGVITNAIERLEFTLSERGRRSFDASHPRLDFAAQPTDLKSYLQRQSYRRFEGEVNREKLQRTLSCLSLARLEGQVLPKYRYPSAGGLYPVQAYLFVKPGAVKDMDGGYYYFDPATNALVQLSDPLGTEEGLYAGYLKPLYAAAAFSLYLVADLDAIQPMYGKVAQNFCFIEAGYMGQLLMAESANHLVGICPVGGLEEQEAFRNALKLGASHRIVHSFTGGGISAEQQEYWLEKPRSQADDTEVANSISLDEQILEHLRLFVPEYMLPTRIVFHDKLPLTENGKIDRKILRENSNQVANVRNEETFVAPATPMEQRFAEVLADILGLPRINVEGNFFEMGANSIHMVRIQKRFKDELGRELAVTDLFRYPTLRGLVAFLDKDPDEKRDLSESRERAAKRAAARGRNRNAAETEEV